MLLPVRFPFNMICFLSSAPVIVCASQFIYGFWWANILAHEIASSWNCTRDLALFKLNMSSYVSNGPYQLWDRRIFWETWSLDIFPSAAKRRKTASNRCKGWVRGAESSRTSSCRWTMDAWARNPSSQTWAPLTWRGGIQQMIIGNQYKFQSNFEKCK